LDIRAPSFDSQDGVANRKAFVLKRATVKITSQDVEKKEAPAVEEAQPLKMPCTQKPLLGALSSWIPEQT
jgi:hypothetical protein